MKSLNMCFSESISCGFPAIPPSITLTKRIIGGTGAVPHSWPWLVYRPFRGESLNPKAMLWEVTYF